MNKIKKDILICFVVSGLIFASFFAGAYSHTTKNNKDISLLEAQLMELTGQKLELSNQIYYLISDKKYLMDLLSTERSRNYDLRDAGRVYYIVYDWDWKTQTEVILPDEIIKVNDMGMKEYVDEVKFNFKGLGEDTNSAHFRYEVDIEIRKVPIEEDGDK